MPNYDEYLKYLKLQTNGIDTTLSDISKEKAKLLEEINVLEQQNSEISKKINAFGQQNDKLSKELYNLKHGISTFTDSRDGRVYRTVKIGNQVWMAENLNYDAPGSKCYDNAPANGEKYGRLYNCETAKKVCPPGWHLPSDAEWDVLINAVGGKDTAGKHLKAKSGWNENGNGLDTYCFAALPGGHGGSDGSFFAVGRGGYWWSATEYNVRSACSWDVSYVIIADSVWFTNKSNLYSVRCLQDFAP